MFLLAAIAVNVTVNTQFNDLADDFPFLGVTVWVAIALSAFVRRFYAPKRPEGHRSELVDGRWFDRSRFDEHWDKSLDRWFPDGQDTPGVVMLEIRAKRVNYWEGSESGEVPLTAAFT